AEIVNAITQGRLLRGGRLDTGVEDGDRAVIFGGTSCEAAVRLCSTMGGRKSHRQMAPVNHVWTHGVSPMHVAPDCSTWVVLEKHVVAAPPVDRPVGIVHPIFCGEKVKLWTQRIGGEVGFEGIVLS